MLAKKPGTLRNGAPFKQLAATGNGAAARPADALLDASRRDDIVLDSFGRSGTTLIAAERCGRRAHMIEIDPYYCDVIIRRFEKESGLKTVAGDGDTLADRAAPGSHAAFSKAIDPG